MKKYPDVPYVLRRSRSKTTLRALLSICVGVAAATLIANAQGPSKAVLGRWDLTLATPKGELPSWIEISNDNGPKILMVGVTDHATPLKNVQAQRR